MKSITLHATYSVAVLCTKGPHLLGHHNLSFASVIDNQAHEEEDPVACLIF